jgi:hypothetical protein
MPYLDAALAFALTMLALSTLVTWLLRFGQWVARLRRKVMKEMLAEYFAKELKPVVERELDRLQSSAKAALLAEAEKLGAKDLYTGDKAIITEQQYQDLTELSTGEMVEWLKRTEMGGKLLKELGDKGVAIFDELGKRYDAVGDRFTKSFRASARIWGTLIALAVALLLNVDSIFIAKTYMGNEGMRQAVIAQKESLEQGYTDLQETLEQDATKTEITREEFEQAFSDAEAQLDFFTSAGFPIGYSYYPYACGQENDIPDCTERGAPVQLPFFGRVFLFGDLTWTLGIFLTGLLAGLGGPFWFDVVSGISRAAQSAKKKPEDKSEG